MSAVAAFISLTLNFLEVQGSMLDYIKKLLYKSPKVATCGCSDD